MQTATISATQAKGIEAARDQAVEKARARHCSLISTRRAGYELRQSWDWRRICCFDQRSASAVGEDKEAALVLAARGPHQHYAFSSSSRAGYLQL